jgi:trimeric autotransporter adhesin
MWWHRTTPEPSPGAEPSFPLARSSSADNRRVKKTQGNALEKTPLTQQTGAPAPLRLQYMNSSAHGSASSADVPRRPKTLPFASSMRLQISPTHHQRAASIAGSPWLASPPPRTPGAELSRSRHTVGTGLTSLSRSLRSSNASSSRDSSCKSSASEGGLYGSSSSNSGSGSGLGNNSSSSSSSSGIARMTSTLAGALASLTGSNNTSELYYCQICFEHGKLGPQSYTLSACQHVYCRACLTAYLISKVTDGQVYPLCFHTSSAPTAAAAASRLQQTDAAFTAVISTEPGSSSSNTSSSTTNTAAEAGAASAAGTAATAAAGTAATSAATVSATAARAAAAAAAEASRGSCGKDIAEQDIRALLAAAGGGVLSKYERFKFSKEHR